MTTKTRKAALPLDTILDGDCIEVMRSLPEASIDLIFADPPYLSELSIRILSALDNSSVLSPDPLIIIEERKNFSPPAQLRNLYLADCRNYGESSFYFYEIISS